MKKLTLILATVGNGKGHCGSPEMKIPNPTYRRIENRKIYAIKEIKIFAEYWDRYTGFQPIGLSPGFWQIYHVPRVLHRS